MPYTACDTPQIRQRIEADLKQISAVVRRGDPALRGLVLTGGFSRGEGTAVDGEPQNDYDLVAVRGMGRPTEPYEAMRSRLEEQLGLHIDLCAVPSWRLPWVPRSIFWYETKLRGRVLWGAPVLDRVRPIEPDEIEPEEGLRLLVNRAAGLLLCTDERMGWDPRIQAAKALLAATDARLLATGRFPPTHQERLQEWLRLPLTGTCRLDEEETRHWVQWAHDHKLRPQDHPPADDVQAWQAAAFALLDAVPIALRAAGFVSLDHYARQERPVEWLAYQRNMHHVEGARRTVGHPTARTRAATLELLQVSLTGHVPQALGRRILEPLVSGSDDVLKSLDQLRHATMQ